MEVYCAKEKILNKPHLPIYFYISSNNIEDAINVSSSDKVMLSFYSNYANCYIVKPVDTPKIDEVITGIEKFWTSIAYIPNQYLN